MTGKICWRSLYFDGREELTFRINSNGLLAESVITWRNQEQKHLTKYEIACRPDWSTKYVKIFQDNHHQLTLMGDGKGNWQDNHNQAIKELEGCVDIDFQATPSTNILPVRRLHAKAKQRRQIRVVYMTFPELHYYPVEQFYTKLNNEEWLFEQPEDNFSATIKVDENGFVTDYPGLFKRD